MKKSMIIAAAIASAAAHATPPTAQYRARLAFAYVGEGITRDGFVQEIQNSLNRFDSDRNGLDAADIELLRQRQQAQERAQSVQTILALDLDGDFSVDRIEIARARPDEYTRASSNSDSRFTDLFNRYDANRDGRIGRDELFSAPLPQANFNILEDLRGLLAQDPNQDGRLVEEEATALLGSLFEAIDENRDGRLSAQELDDDGRRTRETRPIGIGRQCALPRVPADAVLVAFGAQTGFDMAASTPGIKSIPVTVEPGARPIYAVLRSNAQIEWRLSGAVDRIAQLVLIGEGNRDGAEPPQVSGVTADHVVVVPPGCLSTSGDIWSSTGVRPAVVAQGMTVAALTLPSGEFVNPYPARPDFSRPTSLCTDLKAPPLPAGFGGHGVQAHYSFVTQGARDGDLGTFLKTVSTRGFSFVPITISINGFDTLVIPGRRVLHDATEVASEFREACALETGKKIFLAHAQYNLTTEQGNGVRVR